MQARSAIILSYDLDAPPAGGGLLVPVAPLRLSLLGLHGYEKDQRARQQTTGLTPVPHRIRVETTMVLAQQLIDASKDGGAA